MACSNTFTRVRCWHPADEQGFIVCTITRACSSAAPHVHRLHQVSVVESGAATVAAEGSEWHLNAGDVAYHPPMTLHATHANGAWRCRTFSFDSSFADRWGRDVRLPRATTVVRHRKLAAQLLDLHHGLERGTTTGSASDLLASLEEVACERFLVLPAREAPGAITRCIRQLRDAYTDRLPLDDLSRIASLSKFHLVRLFGRLVGMTPHALIVWLRLAHARTLYVMGETASRAAYDAGFADHGHFIRTCRHLLGVTPTVARALEAAAPASAECAAGLPLESRRTLARLWRP